MKPAVVYLLAVSCALATGLLVHWIATVALAIALAVHWLHETVWYRLVDQRREIVDMRRNADAILGSVLLPGGAALEWWSLHAGPGLPAYAASAHRPLILLLTGVLLLASAVRSAGDVDVTARAPHEWRAFAWQIAVDLVAAGLAITVAGLAPR